MDAPQALKLSIDAGDLVALGYIEDLSDAEMLRRPAPNCNHINWQLGHLLVSSNYHLAKAAPGQEKALPPGFAEKYTNETSKLDDPSAFATKEELLRVHAEQRAAMLSVLEKQTDAELERASGVEYAPTVAAIFSMEGSHFLMHAGQWAVVRRQLGRPPLF